MAAFVDEVDIKVESGAGGRGCESYRMRSDRKRVPEGGNGGCGGDVVFQADRNVTSLEDLKFRQRICAASGEPGGANGRTGRSSAPVIVKVPCGTLITDRATHLRIRELNAHADSVVVAKGGQGGIGNHGGGSTREPERAMTVDLHVVLKLASDVVLIGFPSSGKSTLLNHLTRAHAKTGAYSFSTSAPELGMLETDDFCQLKICELPGVIQGSHQGKGLGNAFLRHALNTRLVLILLDPYNAGALTVSENYRVILEELRHYKPELLSIPRMVLINKADLADFKERFDAESFRIEEPCFVISALSGYNLPVLRKELEHSLQP